MKEKIWGLKRNIFFLGLTSLFNDFSAEMIVSIFPAFFTSVLKAGAASLGLVEGFAEGISNIFKIYSGRLSDRLQKRKKLVVIGYMLSVLTRPIYLLAATVSHVFGLRFVDRIGKGLRDAPRDAIISLSTDQDDLGRSFGYHRAMDATGAILGPLVAFLILYFWPTQFHLVFLTSFVIGLLALFSLVFIHDVVVTEIKGRQSSPVAFTTPLPLRFKTFLLAIFILSVGSLPLAVLLLKTTSIGLLIASIPLFYMVYNLSYAGFSIPAGRLSDQIGPQKIIFIGYVLLVFAYLVLGLAQSWLILLAGFLLLGFFSAFTDGVQRSLASQLSLEEHRGRALGLLNAALGFGAMVAGVLGGYVWQNYGPTMAMTISTIIILVGLLLFALTFSLNKNK